jgi:hypothetical protein
MNGFEESLCTIDGKAGLGRARYLSRKNKENQLAHTLLNW